MAPIELATGKQAYLRGQAQPPDDAHRPEAAGRPLPRTRPSSATAWTRTSWRASRSGLDTILVLSGVTTRENDAAIPLPAPTRSRRRGRYSHSGTVNVTWIRTNLSHPLGERSFCALTHDFFTKISQHFSLRAGGIWGIMESKCMICCTAAYLFSVRSSQHERSAASTL